MTKQIQTVKLSEELREKLVETYNNLNVWFGADNLEDQKKHDEEDIKNLSTLLAQAQQEAVETEWKEFTSAPKDREVLVAFLNQGNVVQLCRYNNVRGYWESKGKPMLGLTSQNVLWTDVPALQTKGQDD